MLLIGKEGRAIITGKLSKDAEVKTSAKGTEFLAFSVLAERGKNKDSTFCDVMMFDKDAIPYATALTKGTYIIVTARQETREYKERLYTSYVADAFFTQPPPPAPNIFVGSVPADMPATFGGA